MIIKFKPEHLENIKQRNVDKTNLLEFMEGIKNKHYEGYTIIKNNEVVACGGVFEVWNGVAEAWVVASEGIYKHSILFHKASKKFLMDISTKYHRVQAIVKADFGQSLRWVKLIGFEIEGFLKKYTPEKEDCFIYRLGEV